jgi:2,4-dienoyl-CoA reductase-like NADH-dependent reductase (Old Yellow Enzyme family)/thioredoxin reductase
LPVEFKPWIRTFGKAAKRREIAKASTNLNAKGGKEMAELKKLFSPGKIGSLELKNRLIQAPTMGIAPFHGVPLPEEAKEDYIPPRVMDYFVERAKGGVSLTLGQSCTILPEGRAPGRAGCWDDKFIPGLRKFAEAIHQHGAKVAFQLLHHGRILTAHRKGMPHPEEIDPVAPSAIPWGHRKEVAREATVEDIKRLVNAFAEAARRLRDAGFDCVEVKGAHGYCVGQFLSPHSNQRTDEYGGSPEKRARFACEIISAIKKRAGADFPLLFLMSSSEFIKGGISLEDSLIQARLFAEAGADALHVEGGVADMTAYITNPCYVYPDALFVDHAAAIKKVVSVPIIAGGKIGDPILANQILEEGKADFISMARALIADPYLPNKAKEGKFDEIVHCLWCNNCWDATWRESFKKYGVRSCTVNPAYNREKEFTLEPTKSPKKVLVAGGGLAGMEAARVLARRGHPVELFEKSQGLGGQWNLASLIKLKQHYARLTEQMSNQLGEAGVRVTCGQEVTTELVRQKKPEVLIVATGALPRSLKVPGAQGENVVQAVDVLRGTAKVGRRTLVVGGRYLGIEVALLLAEQGKHVSLVTERNLGQNSRYMEHYQLLSLRDKLVEQGVYIYPHSPLLEIYGDGVYVMNGVDPLFLKADTVVLAVGFSPQRKLLEELKNAFPNLKIHAIGDCVEARDALEAIRDGAEVGRII